MVFIDEHGRVYKNWNSYIEENLLPDGIALSPSRGCYTYENGKLSMDAWPTPASKSASKLVATTDFAAGVGAFAAVGITLASLALPVSAPLIAAASFLGVGSGVYTAVRSGYQLMDRSEHEQSVDLTNSQSRQCWLGVTAGTLAVSSSVANKVIKRVATAGREVTLLEETVVKGMNVAAMLISGTGVVNGVVYIMIKLSDDQKTSATDWLQIAGFLAIFTHSLHNYRLASNIMSQSRGLRTSSFKSIIREMTEKITTSTTATHGNIDLIRLTNMIPDNYAHILAGIDLAYRLYKMVEPLVLSKDSFNDCINSLCRFLDQKIVEFLVTKTNEFIGKFRSAVEKYIRTTLFFETALWDLYKECEKHLKTKITIQNVNARIDTIFRSLLEHYEQMKPMGRMYFCRECNGYYRVTK